jgi:C-terminal processing protease CtpA/Prc
VALRGTVSIWSDGNEFGRNPPHAFVVARPVTCAELRSALVDSIARALRRNYVWPDTAARMAERLAHQLRAGAYDTIADPAALAAALTHDLRTVYHDVHLSVSYESARNLSGDSVSARASRGARQDAAPTMERQQSFGFRDARILPGNIGYVAIDHLFDVSPQPQATLDSVIRIVRQGSALILDLRNNHGGSPEMVRAISNYLFPAPTHINDLFERRSGTTTAYWTEPDRRVTTLFSVPVSVLVSHETFSAAEELAYDLQSRHRAVIVGETTGGGAHAVWGIPVGQGFVANVPYARAINPVTKTNWEGVGVRPDVSVRADSALEAAVRRYREPRRE